MTAPVLSITVPRMVAVIFWANEGTPIRVRRIDKQAIFFSMEDASGSLFEPWRTSSGARFRKRL
jgi:hypothetical protein